MKNLVNYYDSQGSKNYSASSLSASATVTALVPPQPILPVPIAFPESLSNSPFKSSEDGNPNLPGTPVKSKSPEMFGQLALTPSHPIVSIHSACIIMCVHVGEKAVLIRESS